MSDKKDQLVNDIKENKITQHKYNDTPCERENDGQLHKDLPEQQAKNVHNKNSDEFNEEENFNKTESFNFGFSMNVFSESDLEKMLHVLFMLPQKFGTKFKNHKKVLNICSIAHVFF